MTLPRLILILSLVAAVAAPAAAQDAGLLAIPDPLRQPIDPAAPAKPEPPKPAPEPEEVYEPDPMYRDAMREIAIEIARYGEERRPGFVVLARGGLELLQDDVFGSLGAEIDGIVVDGLYCPAAVPPPPFKELKPLTRGGLRLLSLDICPNDVAAADAARRAESDGVLQYTAPDSRVDALAGRPPHENAEAVTRLDQARNVAFLLSASGASDATDWVLGLQRTNHDLLVIDPFFRGKALTAADVASLRHKRVGSRRLILAVLPVAIAQPGRFYWKDEWLSAPPPFLEPDLRGPQGGMFARYWEPGWKEILGRYVKGLVDLGFDGIMLDGLGAFAAFEPIAPPAETEERKPRQPTG